MIGVSVMQNCKIYKYFKKISNVDFNQRMDLVENLKIKNYGTSELTETEMWILTNAADNAEYLNKKLRENNKLTLDVEAPEENQTTLSTEPSVDSELSFDDEVTQPTDDQELSLDDETEELSFDDEVTQPTDDQELSLDDETEELSFDDEVTQPTDDQELSLDDETEELSLDEEPPQSVESDSDDSGDSKIETSIAGVGILPLLGEIQDKLANGKPSEVELAALKAMKKLF